MDHPGETLPLVVEILHKWLTVFVALLVVDIRLDGFGSPYQGVVEVFHKNEWGSVGGKYANFATDSSVNICIVVCRQLGLPGPVSFLYGFVSSAVGLRPSWLKDVHCDGTEDVLTLCEHSEWERGSLIVPENCICGKGNSLKNQYKII